MYMVLGATIIREENVPLFNDTMKEYRERHHVYKELKWSRVTNQYFEKYKAFTDYFFALNNTNKIRFKCLILDNHRINHRKFNDGDKEKGFYKFWYQLLLHRFLKRYYDEKRDTRFIIYMDERNTSYKLNDLRVILNGGFSKYLQKPVNPVRTVEPKNSKKSEIIQVNDIILGAIGFEKNGYHLLSESRESKKQLCAEIASSAGLQNLSDDTRYGQNRFEIWNFRLRQ